MNFIELVESRSRTAWLTGIALLILGSLSLLAPLAAGLSIAILVGMLLTIAGVAQLALVVQAGSLGRGFLLLLSGFLGVAAGISMVSQPGIALANLTLLLAAYFVATGIIEFISAVQARPQSGWGWLAWSAVLSVLLGAMIWSQFPLSGTWAIGLLAGVRLLSAGGVLVGLGAAGSRAAKATSD